jgi:hypothetical protein
MSLSDPLRVTRKLVSVLDDLGIPYLVGGSLASSLYGVPRATQDVDVVVDEVDCERLTRLAEVLKEDFFVDIVHKLYWYKLGDGVSERQWNDAHNVIKVQSKALDMSYLHRVAQMRGVEDLLKNALMAT